MIAPILRFFMIPTQERKEDDEFRQRTRALSKTIDKRMFGVHRTQLWPLDADGIAVLDQYFGLPIFSNYPTETSFITVGAISGREEDMKTNQSLVSNKQGKGKKVLVRALSCERYQTRGMFLQSKRAGADGVEINFAFDSCESEDVFNNTGEVLLGVCDDSFFVAVNLSKFQYGDELFLTIEGLVRFQINALVLRRPQTDMEKAKLSEILHSCKHEIVYV